MDNRPVLLVDIDGTVADSTHRNHFLEVEHESDVNWPAWEREGFKDTPIQQIVELVRAMRAYGYRIVFLTSRNETCCRDTYEWLTAHNIAQFGDLILTRKDGDLRPSPMVKRDHVRKLKEAGANLQLSLEDHSGNVAMFREEGIMTLHVADY